MKSLASILFLALASVACGSVAEPTTAPADATPVVTPVERANRDAVARLYAQIAAESLGQVPVAQIVERVDGYAILMNGLARAEQIGGPRVVGEDFVQVQLQINGSRAAQLVLQAVSVNPQKSPVPPDRAARLLQDWNHRVFTSTGTSVEPQEAMPLEPTTTPTTPRRVSLDLDVAPAWARSPISASGSAERQQSRLRTARAAEQTARDTLRRKIEELVLVGERTMGEVAKEDEDIRRVIDNATAAASIFGADYRSDGSVELRVSLDGQQLWQAILATR